MLIVQPNKTNGLRKMGCFFGQREQRERWTAAVSGCFPGWPESMQGQQRRQTRGSGTAQQKQRQDKQRDGVRAEERQRDPGKRRQRGKHKDSGTGGRRSLKTEPDRMWKDGVHSAKVSIIRREWLHQLYNKWLLDTEKHKTRWRWSGDSTVTGWAHPFLSKCPWADSEALFAAGVTTQTVRPAAETQTWTCLKGRA